MLKEFKEFAMKGNLIDMAVGFVMGGAFATVVTAFIQGVFLPVLAPIMGGIDLSSLKFTIVPAELDAAGAVVRRQPSSNWAPSSPPSSPSSSSPS